MSEAKNELIVPEKIDPKELLVEGKGVETLLEMIKGKAYDYGQDISTKKARGVVRTIANDIARSKTFLVAHADKIKKPHQAVIGPVNKNIKKIKDTLDALKAEYRKPLTDYENAEEKRIAEEKAEETRLFKEKIDTRHFQFTSIGIAIPYQDVATMSDEEFETRLSLELEAQKAERKRLEEAKKIEDERIAEEKRVEDERLEKISADQKAEAERLAMIKKEQDKDAAVLKAQQDQIAADQKAIQDAKDQLEREAFEKQAKENAKIQAEKDAKDAAEKAEAEKKALEAAEIAEAKRVQDLKPDRQKALEWIETVHDAVPQYDIESELIAEILHATLGEIFDILHTAEMNVEKLCSPTGGQK